MRANIQTIHQQDARQMIDAQEVYTAGVDTPEVYIAGIAQGEIYARCRNNRKDNI